MKLLNLQKCGEKFNQKIINFYFNNIMKEHLEESTSKYKDPSNNEPFMDNHLFFPLSDLLVTPLRNTGLTPNGITLLSSIFQLYTIVLLSEGKVEFACISYFIGYLFDCIDGNMARKFNMGSKYGMALDMVSDNVVNIILAFYIIYNKGINVYIAGLLVASYLLGVCTGINEALSSYKTTKSDNFYAKKQKEFEHESYLIADIYLLIIKNIYNNYKILFPTYDENLLNSRLYLLKEFGPGNFAIGMIAMLYFTWKY